MALSSVNITVPFDSLFKSVKKLDVEEKYKLWNYLNAQIEQYDEDLLEQDPIVKEQIQEALADYESGDFVTLDEYHKRRKASST